MRCQGAVGAVMMHGMGREGTHHSSPWTAHHPTHPGGLEVPRWWIGEQAVPCRARDHRCCDDEERESTRRDPAAGEHGGVSGVDAWACAGSAAAAGGAWWRVDRPGGLGSSAAGRIGWAAVRRGVSIRACVPLRCRRWLMDPVRVARALAMAAWSTRRRAENCMVRAPPVDHRRPYLAPTSGGYLDAALLTLKVRFGISSVILISGWRAWARSARGGNRGAS